MIDALTNALTDADADPATRVIILTASGSVFSSGGNVKKMQIGAGLADAESVRTLRNYRHGIQRIPLTFETLEVPIIAAVNRPAIGAG